MPTLSKAIYMLYLRHPEGIMFSYLPTPRKEALEALVPDYVKRLSRKGVTVKSLHEEYL